jgi:hypothetical protein
MRGRRKKCGMSYRRAISRASRCGNLFGVTLAGMETSEF